MAQRKPSSSGAGPGQATSTGLQLTRQAEAARRWLAAQAEHIAAEAERVLGIPAPVTLRIVLPAASLSLLLWIARRTVCGVAPSIRSSARHFLY